MVDLRNRNPAARRDLRRMEAAALRHIRGVLQTALDCPGGQGGRWVALTRCPGPQPLSLAGRRRRPAPHWTQKQSPSHPKITSKGEFRWNRQ
jgi:hypothetical protein